MELHQSKFQDVTLQQKADCVITSPPYKIKEGFGCGLIEDLFTWLTKNTNDKAKIFINFGQLKENLSLIPGFTQVAEASGFTLNQTIIWVKSIAIGETTYGHFQPINSKKTLNYCWEYIFFFSKGEVELDKLSIGVPYMDESNLTRGTRGKNGDIHCRGDVWFIPYETTGTIKKKKHKYQFPDQLVRNCILISGLQPGSVVVDPMCGSGTVPRVVEEMGFMGIGIEKLEK